MNGTSLMMTRFPWSRMLILNVWMVEVRGMKQVYKRRKGTNHYGIGDWHTAYIVLYRAKRLE